MSTKLLPKLAAAIAGATLSLGVAIDAIPAWAASSYTTYNFSGIFNPRDLNSTEYYGSIQFFDAPGASLPPELTFLRITKYSQGGNEIFSSQIDSPGIAIDQFGTPINGSGLNSNNWKNWRWWRANWKISLYGLENHTEPFPNLTLEELIWQSPGNQLSEKVDDWKQNQSVPEPTSVLSLLGIGMLGIDGLRKKNKIRVSS